MLSNLSTSLSRTTVRNVLYALGHVEALRDRARFEGAEVPFASMPFAAVGEEGVLLSALTSLPKGTSAKRSKIVRGMILDGELVLTAQRTLHLPGTL